jgi:hypothetical protein
MHARRYNATVHPSCYSISSMSVLTAALARMAVRATPATCGPVPELSTSRSSLTLPSGSADNDRGSAATSVEKAPIPPATRSGEVGIAGLAAPAPTRPSPTNRTPLVSKCSEEVADHGRRFPSAPPLPEQWWRTAQHGYDTEQCYIYCFRVETTVVVIIASPERLSVAIADCTNRDIASEHCPGHSCNRALCSLTVSCRATWALLCSVLFLRIINSIVTDVALLHENYEEIDAL